MFTSWRGKWAMLLPNPSIMYASKMSIFHIIVHKQFYLVAKTLQISCSPILALHQPPFHLSALLELLTSVYTHKQTCTRIHMHSHTPLTGGKKSRHARIVCLCHTPVKPLEEKEMDPVSWVTLTRYSTICGAPSLADARPGRAVCLESHQPRNRVGGCDAICSTCANREETLGTGKGEGGRPNS